jgi:hypothetical protein
MRREPDLTTDYTELTENLSRFYDFTGRVVLFIGAAGRQLLNPATPARKLIAVDKDADALLKLKAVGKARHCAQCRHASPDLPEGILYPDYRATSWRARSSKSEMPSSSAHFCR